jgi:hypothetical protein
MQSKNKKQAQNSVPASRATLNLPGLRSAKDLSADEIRKLKIEYNSSLHEYQKNNKKVKSLQGSAKRDMQRRLKSTKEHLDSLLIKIGDHTSAERVSGFEGIDDGK